MLLLTLGQGLHIKGHCWGPGFTREPSYTARCDSYHGHRRKGQNTHWQFGKYQIVISFMIQFLYKFILIGFFVRKIFLGSEAEYLSRFFLSLQNPWPAFILFYIFLFFLLQEFFITSPRKIFSIFLFDLKSMYVFCTTNTFVTQKKYNKMVFLYRS